MDDDRDWIGDLNNSLNAAQTFLKNLETETPNNLLNMTGSACDKLSTLSIYADVAVSLDETTRNRYLTTVNEIKNIFTEHGSSNSLKETEAYTKIQDAFGTEFEPPYKNQAEKTKYATLRPRA